MAARGALADRVRVADADYRYFSLYGACDEGGQEGVHGACACRSSTACLGCALLRAPAAGLARARPRRGCSRRRVGEDCAAVLRASSARGRMGRHGNDTNLQHYRSVRVCETGASQSAPGRRRRGTASGRNRGSTTAMQEQSIWGSPAQLARLRAAPVTADSHRAREHPSLPPLDARATAPSASSARVKPDSLLPQSCPAATMVAALLYHWVATHLYLLTSWAGLAAITIIIARWQWERVERLVKARIIREMERKAGVPISIEALTCRPIKGELGLTNLIVKGSEGKWRHAYFMRIEKLTCKAHGGLLGCASLAGMVSFDLGTHLPFIVGFKGKMVDAMTCVGMEVYVETSHTGSSNADFLREIDRADRRKTRARGRKAHEAELRWKLCWVSDAKERTHLATTLAALLEEDEEERLAEEALWEHQHHGDAEHAAFSTPCTRISTMPSRIARTFNASRSITDETP